MKARDLAKELKNYLLNEEEGFFIAKKPLKTKAKKQVKPEIKPAKTVAPKAKTISAKTKPEIKTEVKTTVQDKSSALAELAEKIKTCTRCELGKTRIKAVPGEGNINAKLMFIGEGPGFDEDRQGRPFVGRAGQLLDKIIAAMGFKREEVFIANMVKCHPMKDPTTPDKHANDRAPNQEEIALCRRYIEQQIAIISPDYIVALGFVAGRSLIKDSPTFSAIRGKIYDLNLTYATPSKPIKILATFHPAALLRNPAWKKDAWADLKVMLAAMGREPQKTITKQG
ncbi:MAG: uracil-DNA glycosylase [Elusimicrobiaceae bacterium]|nr:uracil-DNA glycosylase [Elusimicrobiaceae bacterium]